MAYFYKVGRSRAVGELQGGEWHFAVSPVVPSTYHDDPSRLLCGTHAHDRGHANGRPLEINPAEKQKTKQLS